MKLFDYIKSHFFSKGEEDPLDEKNISSTNEVERQIRKSSLVNYLSGDALSKRPSSKGEGYPLDGEGSSLANEVERPTRGSSLENYLSGGTVFTGPSSIDEEDSLDGKESSEKHKLQPSIRKTDVTDNLYLNMEFDMKENFKENMATASYSDLKKEIIFSSGKKSTLLHCAVAREDRDILGGYFKRVEELLNLGNMSREDLKGILNTKDSNGHTPKDVAEKNGVPPFIRDWLTQNECKNSAEIKNPNTAATVRQESQGSPEHKTSRSR